jgi:hypothetical protein
MNPGATRLLRRFVDELGGDVQVAVRRGAGRSERWESQTEIREVVTGFYPDAGVVELELAGQLVRLHFDEAELLELLRGASESAAAAFGERVSDEEAAAGFLMVFFEESVGSEGRSPSGWWTYEDHHFLPRPPWEAFAQRRRRP